MNEVEAYRLPVKTERLLLSYLESVGRYAKAEDSLYRLWEYGEDVTSEGHELYGRLLLTAPEALVLGGLPLEEVRQGQAEWEKLTAAAKQETNLR
ncbi:hypothetical protein D3C74_389310 [compost metagenome]